jgi:3-isopropylmalate/(R)-2-methylmalate dehydratase small subunit
MQFGGRVLFLDRSNINTDEIIPARYLTEDSKAALKPHLLEDLKLDGFTPQFARQTVPAHFGAIVTRANFGCGSSREHAPWALEQNGIRIVIAESFARIFRQNMYNCGMIAAEVPASVLEEIFSEFGSTETQLSVDTEKGAVIFSAGSKQKTVAITLQGFEKALVDAGGWVEYAARKY